MAQDYEAQSHDPSAGRQRQTAAPGDGDGQRAAGSGTRGKEPCFPPVSFTTFLLSLASSAMVHLGEAPEPASGQLSPDIALAKHTIDILAMLECKTRGNVARDEAELLEHLLCELRLIYVKKC